MSALPGHPGPLLDRAEGYLDTAVLLQEATSELHALDAHDGSLAIGRVGERVTATAGLLDAARERFAGAASALRDYAIALQHAHDRADTAARERSWHESRRAAVIEELEQQDRHLDLLRGEVLAPAVAIARLEQAREDTSRRLMELDAAISAQDALLRDVAADVDAAAQQAIAVIDAAIGPSGNDVWDSVAHAFEHAIGGIAELWSAFIDRLSMSVGTVLGAAAAVLSALAVPVVIAAVIGLLAAALAVVGGSVSLAAAALGGVIGTPAFWLIAAAAGVAAEIALLDLIVRVRADHGAPTPEVRHYRPEGASSGELEALEDSRAQERYLALDDFLETAGYVDRLGGDHEGEPDRKTVVDIKRMGGEPPSWVITLPSTQDWQFAGLALGQRVDPGDAGAVNDLGTNIALMIDPQSRTQYERAVMEAMRQAGIGPDDPVMLVGFSQGGILAAHLAAHRSDEVNVTRVLVVGAPIDGMPIPDTSRSGADVKVLSIQHVGDPVPALDLVAAQPDLTHWTTLSPVALDPTTGRELVGGAAHHGRLYEATAQRLLRDDPSIDEAFRAFMGSVIVHQQYEFAE